MRRAASTRIASRRADTERSASMDWGVSVPARPTSLARTKTTGFVASTSDASTPSTTSRGFPVGRRRPVPAPPGSRKSSAIRAPRPGTPASSKSPSTAASPSVTGTWATMSFRVLVLWMRARGPRPAGRPRGRRGSGWSRPACRPRGYAAASRAPLRVGEEPAREEDVALARRQHARGREALARACVEHAHTVAGGERGAQAVEAQPVTLFERVVGGPIVEREWHDPPVDQVRPVDPRERLGEHRAHAEVHRAGRGGLARGALAVELARDDDPAPCRLRASDELRVDVLEGELGDRRDVGAEDEHRGAGGGDVVGRYLIAQLQQHPSFERLGN